MLPHRTNAVVFFFIIIEVLRAEREGLGHIVDDARCGTDCISHRHPLHFHQYLPCRERIGGKKRRGFVLKPLLCWDTRTRTRKNRTRICCVTITTYPNFIPASSEQTPLVLNCDAKVRRFFSYSQTFPCFFSPKQCFFRFVAPMTQ